MSREIILLLFLFAVSRTLSRSRAERQSAQWPVRTQKELSKRRVFSTGIDAPRYPVCSCACLLFVFTILTDRCLNVLPFSRVYTDYCLGSPLTLFTKADETSSASSLTLLRSRGGVAATIRMESHLVEECG